MAKYTCSTCGIGVDRAWDVCNPVENKSAAPSGEQSGRGEKEQKLGKYVCGSCGNLSTDPHTLCHPGKI